MTTGGVGSPIGQAHLIDFPFVDWQKEQDAEQGGDAQELRRTSSRIDGVLDSILGIL